MERASTSAGMPFSRHGSFTFEESLARLVKDGVVEWREAQARARHAEEFEQLAPRAPPSHP